VPLPEDPSKTPEQLEAERAAMQEAIDNAEPLTEEEIAEKDELSSLGFFDWTRKDFNAFLRGSEFYGKCVVVVVVVCCTPLDFSDD
jgi:SWI/SNF-related matrix-associated actin-dependent regulator of chromatin subfamily A member 5